MKNFSRVSAAIWEPGINQIGERLRITKFPFQTCSFKITGVYTNRTVGMTKVNLRRVILLHNNCYILINVELLASGAQQHPLRTDI